MVGLVLAGEIIASCDSLYFSEEGMATPEFRWPTTRRMSLSAAMLAALATPTSGLAWSSNGTSSTLKPIFSSGPFSLSTASWVPSLMPSPSAAGPRDSGLGVAILIVPLLWAGTSPLQGSTSASAASAMRTTRNRAFLIASLLQDNNELG